MGLRFRRFELDEIPLEGIKGFVNAKERNGLHCMPAGSWIVCSWVQNEEFMPATRPLSSGPRPNDWLVRTQS